MIQNYPLLVPFPITGAISQEGFIEIQATSYIVSGSYRTAVFIIDAVRRDSFFLPDMSVCFS